MKKTLLLLLSVTLAQLSFGQEFVNTDFAPLTVGNFGTDITGVTPGQGNWLTTATNGTAPTTTTNADNSNFQIVDAAGTNGNVVQITGPNGDKGNKIMWQGGLPAWWASRTVGNNIIEVEYDFFTGPATASANNMRMLIYDAPKTKILAGLSVVMSTKVISGVAYYDNTASPGGLITNYLFNLATPPLVLPADTWVRVGMSFNYTTGEVKWKGPGFNGFVMGAGASTDPAEVDIVATSGSTQTVPNTASTTGLYDNMLVRNSATDTLLGVAESATITELSVYPNPSNDIVNITNNGGINTVQITDINGRVIKSIKTGNATDVSINVSDLTSGIYIMNIDAENGKSTKKIIKN